MRRPASRRRAPRSRSSASSLSSAARRCRRRRCSSITPPYAPPSMAWSSPSQRRSGRSYRHFPLAPRSPPPASARSAAAGPTPGVLVPASAVLQRDARAVLYVLEGGRVHIVPVTPRGDVGEMRQVEGIAAGAQVVVAPPADLTDGATVDWSEAGK